MLSTDKYQRYQRQILLKEFGDEAQSKLLIAKILVVGAGGLGCPALQYLAAAGVGTIAIIDFDQIELSNLQRQVLYTIDDIGKYKADIARKKLKASNPEIEIVAITTRIDTHNAIQLITAYDVVVDGSDNFSTRYLLNDACVLLNKPLIYGAVSRFEGQVGVFNVDAKNIGVRTNYRDLFPKPPEGNDMLSCNEVGVLGVVPGIIGTLQAAEAIKIITGIGEVLSNQIISYNILSNSFYKFNISPSEISSNAIPKTETEFLNYDYDWFCGVQIHKKELSIEAFNSLKEKEKILIIDVREAHELPEVNDFSTIRIPMTTLAETPIAETTETIVVFCQTGKRSSLAVKIISARFSSRKVYSLAGGIEAWNRHQQNNVA